MASPTQIGIATFPSAASQSASRRYLGFVAAAGLLNALIVAFLFLHLPADHHPTLTSLTVRAILFVLIGAFAGTAGSWFYWLRSAPPFRANPPIPFQLFALAAAAGWVWVPAIVLLSREDSPVTTVVTVLAAALLATALRKAIPSQGLLAPALDSSELPSQPLFAATLRTPRYEVHGYLAALGIYFAAYELNNGWILDAAGLLAVCAFLIAWKRLPEPTVTPDSQHQAVRAARRVAIVLLPAILITLFALLYGIEHRNHLEAIAAAEAAADSQSQTDEARDPQTKSQAANGIAGYHSLILWPVPEKRQIVAPLPLPTNFLAPGTTKPLVIKFDGPYLYFQPPNHGPSPNSHQAHGTPLVADIQTNNFMSLIMEAHQPLGTSIPLARCREIQLGILNSDNRAGAINLAVLLTNSASPGNQVYLGQQPVASSQPGNFSIKSAPASETLRFSIPASPKLRKFDEITVMFFPDSANYDVGPKVAIEQFQLVPR
jgi:hypothetical protein